MVGAWQTERVYFKDVDAGATMIRLTNDRWADELSCFQCHWSADGKTIVFRRRPGTACRSTPPSRRAGKAASSEPGGWLTGHG